MKKQTFGMMIAGLRKERGISQKYEVVGQWEEDQADPGPGKSIFGITIELEDGMIRIYREEERWE